MTRGLLLSAILSAACYYGPNVGEFAPAHSPEGIAADLVLRHRRVRGELLEVQDSAVIVLTDSQNVALVRLASIRKGDFGELGTLIDGPVNQNTVERLRLVSRFPSGLTPELRNQLLTAHGQTELVVIQ